MKFEFFKVAPEDLDEIESKECYSFGELDCSRHLIAIGQLSGTDSLVRGFGLDDGTLLGICGSYRQWDGVGQLWAVFDRRVDRHPLALTKACQTLIAYAKEAQGLRRISLTVKSSYTKGNRFANTLGFAFEGKMYGYLPDGEDANLYARLF